MGTREVRHCCQVSTRYFTSPCVVDWGHIEVDTDETFAEGPVCILDSCDQVL